MFRTFAGLLVFGIAFAGCESAAPRDRTHEIRSDSDQIQQADRMMVRSYFDDQARQAIVRESIVHEHQFEVGAASLTPSGVRSVDRLAQAWRGGSLVVTVRVGDGPPTLQADRIEAVRRRLVAGGVEPSGIRITDGGPQGVGVDGPEALRVNERLSETDSTSVKTSSGVAFDVEGSR